jgi:hypothetical protein
MYRLPLVSASLPDGPRNLALVPVASVKPDMDRPAYVVTVFPMAEGGDRDGVTVGVELLVRVAVDDTVFELVPVADAERLMELDPDIDADMDGPRDDDGLIDGARELEMEMLPEFVTLGRREAEFVIVDVSVLDSDVVALLLTVTVPVGVGLEELETVADLL